MFEKKIHPSTETYAMETYVQGNETSKPSTVVSPSSSQSSTFNGRVVSHSSSTQANTIVLPIVAVPQKSLSPPTYQATAISPTSTATVMGQGTGVSIEEDTTTVTPLTAISNFSQENLKRRLFYIQLQDEFARFIYQENQDRGDRRPRVFMKDGTFIKDRLNELGYRRCLIALTCCFVEAHHDSNQDLQIPLEIKQFSTRFALGIVFQFQNQIPILTDESLKTLREYFISTACQYIFLSEFFHKRYSSINKSYGNSSIYKIFTYEMSHPSVVNKKLSTINGFKFTLAHLLSTGIYTTTGGQYEPTTLKNKQLFDELQREPNFPLYRWGTTDVFNKTWINSIRPNLKTNIQSLDDDKREITFMRVQPEKMPLNRTETNFWQQAKELARQYLNATEWESLGDFRPRWIESEIMNSQQSSPNNQ